MGSLDSAGRRRFDRPVRTLKIEEDGDFITGRVKPKIRLAGHWLERAGFKPGDRVSVTCLDCGVIELRSNGALGTEKSKHSTSNESEHTL